MAGNWQSRYLHFGANSLKKPVGRQARDFGPISRLPGAHWYSITVPLSIFFVISVELVGFSGLPQDNGLYWQIKFKFILQSVSDQSQPLLPSKREQFPWVAGVFQNDICTSFPLIHFQFCGLRVSLMAPSQYWPISWSLRWRR